MKIHLTHNGKAYSADLAQPLDISLTLRDSEENPIAWYLGKPEISPVTSGDWIGKVSEGSSSTNFNNVFFNPHGHGTHTECLGHITSEFYSINEALQQFFYIAKVISITPETQGEDKVISLSQVKTALSGEIPETVVIRTLPNDQRKKSRKYSHTNPPYLSEETATFLRENDVKHLLVDLPSVDREEDGGRLLAHKAFWNVKDTMHVNRDARFGCTITELAFIPDEVADGLYLLNLQMASFENDASPSKPVLYQLESI